MLGQKRNDSLFGPGSRTIEAPQSVLEKQEAALEGSPLDEAVQPPFETQAPATAFTDADDLPRRTIATEAAAGQRVHSLFFTPESESKDFSSVLQDVQEYISGKYSTLITDGVGADTKEQIKRYISKYVQDRRIAVRDLSGEQLVDALYTEMAEFGFLTKYIFGSGIEEININSWRDIEVLYSSGQMVKLEEHFDSPDHAINVIRRMLHVSGMVLDNASPAVLGHLSKNIRIAVLKTPLVDEDVGVCASIRIVNPQNMQKEDFVRGGTATGPMLDFLSACLRYGVSVCVAGATGSGKTTVAGWLLTTIPDNMCEAVGGCFLDLMSGQYRINPLEPKCWDAGGSPEDMDAPAAFRQSTRLSQHISFLRDFFRSYKSFTDRQIDVIEIMVGRLYERWRISDSTDFSRLTPEDYPILSDLYALIEQEYRNFDEGKYQLYTAAILQEILLGLHSMCKGAESKFFNGHTNVTSSRFVVFGVKGLLQASKNVRSAMLFNVLSYLSDKLLTEGNTVAALDELYIWLSDNVAVGTTIIEYIRNCLKRVRKKESAMLLASQNLEDFNQEGIRELTKPLFAIPPHQFLFNAGAVDKKFYMEALQLEESEYNLIRFPQRGVCLYRCGNERYLLEVHAPAYKEALFGKAGGR